MPGIIVSHDSYNIAGLVCIPVRSRVGSFVPSVKSFDFRFRGFPSNVHPWFLQSSPSAGSFFLSATVLATLHFVRRIVIESFYFGILLLQHGKKFLVPFSS